MQSTRYYLGFNLVNGIGPARLARLIDHCGSIDAAWHASTSDLMAAGIDSRTIETILATRQTIDLDSLIERAERLGVRLISRDDPAYPPLLGHIPTAPPLLYVRGTLHDTDQWALAVVGTRSPTLYGKEVARRIVTDLAQMGITIVSGLALGVDSIAHSAALEAGGRTIAVLGCGVDVPYPERNQRLAAQICENGAIISDYPLGTKPVPTNFPPRNRIISGLSRATLVVEAGQRSGALITVDFALEQGRDVFAVPGSIFSAASVGTNRLISNGATLATSAQQILDDLHLATASVQQEVAAVVPADPTETQLLELLTADPIHVDTLGRASGLSAAQILAVLSVMELKGSVRQVGGMQFVRGRW